MPNALQITDPRGDPDNPLTVNSPTWADATDALGTWLAAQRAKSANAGLWNDATGLPTGKGLVSAGQEYGNALLMGTTAPGVRAFHGSPHSFERFDTSKIGSGEGAQAYGHGLYAAENESVAQSYKTAGPAADAQVDAINKQLTQLSKQMDQYSTGQYGKYSDPKGYELKAQYDALMEQRASLGHMYEVQVNADPEHFLHWDKPLSEQPAIVQAKIRNLQARNVLPKGWTPEDMATLTGRDLHQELRHVTGSDAKSAALLGEHVPGMGEGVPGIRYLDQGSRGAGEGSHNYVVFDAASIDILRKYGLAGLMAGGAATGAVSGDSQ